MYLFYWPADSDWHIGPTVCPYSAFTCPDAKARANFNHNRGCPTSIANRWDVLVESQWQRSASLEIRCPMPPPPPSPPPASPPGFPTAPPAPPAPPGGPPKPPITIFFSHMDLVLLFGAAATILICILFKAGMFLTGRRRVREAVRPPRTTPQADIIIQDLIKQLPTRPYRRHSSGCGSGSTSPPLEPQTSERTTSDAQYSEEDASSSGDVGASDRNCGGRAALDGGGRVASGVSYGERSAWLANEGGRGEGGRGRLSTRRRRRRRRRSARFV
jgi:hypothetical protein